MRRNNNKIVQFKHAAIITQRRRMYGSMLQMLGKRKQDVQGAAHGRHVMAALSFAREMAPRVRFKYARHGRSRFTHNPYSSSCSKFIAVYNIRKMTHCCLAATTIHKKTTRVGLK